MWKLLTILVVLALALVAPSEEARYGPCVIGANSPCNKRQWGEQDSSTLNNPPAASPNRPIHIVDYTDKYYFDIPELEPPFYF
ncbi:unnamed protein product [Prunus brigantina]